MPKQRPEQIKEAETMTLETIDATVETVEDEAQPRSPLKEGYYGDVPQSWSPATSFAALDAEREIEETMVDLRARTDDLMMMVQNVVWNREDTDRLSSLRSLFDEYLTVVGEHLAGQPEDAIEAELTEAATAVSLSEFETIDLQQLSELMEFALPDNPRRLPVHLDFAIIQPGHGNKKGKKYYPAEMLEKHGRIFEGADIFMSNHDPQTQTEATKVGRFQTIHGLTEQGLLGTAIIYDPDTAEKARNRADAGELDTLHCSIYASGTGRPATIDGQEVTVIESITQVHSVDLVSRAGAGGHAVALAESFTDGSTPMTDQTELEQPDITTAEQEEGTVQDVEIRESDNDAPVPDDQPVQEQETEEIPDPLPVALSEDEISDLLAESSLDDKSKALLGRFPYPTKEDLDARISEMKEIFAGAGRPFAMGEDTIPTEDVPTLLSAQELEERAAKRALAVIQEIDPSLVHNFA